MARHDPLAEKQRELRRRQRELARQIGAMDRFLKRAPAELAEAARREKEQLREQAMITGADAPSYSTALDPRASEQEPDLAPRPPTRLARTIQTRNAQRQLILLLLLLAATVAFLFHVLPD